MPLTPTQVQAAALPGRQRRRGRRRRPRPPRRSRRRRPSTWASATTRPSFGYFPNKLTVKAGTTVTFVNKSPKEPHNITFGPKKYIQRAAEEDRPVAAGPGLAEPGRAVLALRLGAEGRYTYDGTNHGNGFFATPVTIGRRRPAAARVVGHVHEAREVQVLLLDPRSRHGGRDRRHAVTRDRRRHVTGNALRGPRAIRARGPRSALAAGVGDRAAGRSRARRAATRSSTGSRPSRPPGTSRRTSATRSWARARPEEDDLPDGRLPAVHEGLGEADPERGGRPRHPGAAAPREGRRHRPRPLREPGHAQQPAALDALPRLPLPAGLRRRVPAGLLRARARTCCRASRSPTGSSPATDSAGVWPYHDHSPSMDDSLAGGLYGAISILGPGEQPPDREFVVYLETTLDFKTIDGRAFVGNTPVFHAKVGDLVQWDVLSLGEDHHTFHVHGHRWQAPGGHRHRHAHGRPGRELQDPVARGGSGHVVLPLPRRGSHDAGDDRDLPGVAVRSRRGIWSSRSPARSRSRARWRAYGGSSGRRGDPRGVDPGARRSRPGGSRCCSATRSSGATATARTTRSPPTTTSFDSGFIAPGLTFAQAFTKSGKFLYHCTIHKIRCAARSSSCRSR